VSGVVDPSRLESLPILKVKGGKLVAEEGSSDSLHTAQLAALVAAAEHPLSDSCVALEESLLPVKEAKIAGLNPQLLAVLRMDHLSLRFHRMSSEGKYGVPDHAIVDALLSTVAKRIKP
jgi:aspartyl aminopeptidase